MIYQPKISIVITTYLEETKPYLDLCIKSIENLDYPKEKLDVVLVGRKGYAPEYPNVITVAPPQEKFHNPVGVNYGISKAHPDSEHFLMINDDTILTKNSVKNMVQYASGHDCLIQPISPCDNYSMYHLIFPFRHEDKTMTLVDRFHRYKDLEPYFDALMNTDSVYPPGAFPQPHLCMFATLIPRKVWEKVGGFDENFKTGQDDIDYCKRVKNAGFNLNLALDVLIWHFGGVSADKTMDQSLRQESIKYFYQKWKEVPVYASIEATTV